METKTNSVTAKDNLKLDDIQVAAIPPDILFPDELNKHLRGQLQFLMHTNGMLQRTICDQESELERKTSTISQLTGKVNEFERLTKSTDIQLAGNPTNLLRAKILELTKKLKDKTVENESLKTKVSKMQQKLISFENTPPKAETEILPLIIETESNKSDLGDEVKQLQEKLSQTNNKLFEMKNNNVQLKNELKTANKLLQQEIGDNFTSIQNFTQTTTWRGRQQQIIGLQQKVSELQEKLNNVSDKESTSSTPKSDPRKQIIEQQQKEITNLKTELEDSKKKLNGARARVKVLESEFVTMKNKLSSMESKNQNDEKLVQVLQNQISSMEISNNVIRKEKNAATLKIEEENKRLQTEIQKEKTVIDNLKKIIDERDQKIKDMYEELNNAKSCNPNFANKTHSPADLHKLKVLQVEVNRLLELTGVLNSRLEEERNEHCLTQLNYKKERQRAAKLELKFSRLELETSMNKPNNYGNRSLTKLNSDELYSNIDVETIKNNLELAEENIAILRTKLKIVKKEKELDFQKFSAILSETSSMLLKYNIPHENE